ncbi:MAG TPA: hypothetical protein PKI81_04040 [bacterium]|nr:hypothetical protein [bacterium]HOC87942.1 hypothetical protein [bacterium]HOZ21177.1 hypothetical protein [bacterium]
MRLTFSKKDIDKISRVLGVAPKQIDNKYRFIIENNETKQHISLEIYPDIPIGDNTGHLISVYTPTSHLQLHFCTGFIASDLLGEVTFVSECGGRVSGLIVERGAGCSLYANVEAKLLSGDFSTMGPEVMMSGIALSLAEEILPAGLQEP